MGNLLLSLRPHLWAALLMFFLIAFMAVEQSALLRGLAIAPVMLCFYAFISFYSLEYDELAKNARKNNPIEHAQNEKAK